MDKCTCDFICGFSRVFVLLMLCGGIVFGGLGFISYLAQLFKTKSRSRKGFDPIYSLMSKSYDFYVERMRKNRILNAVRTAGCAILAAGCVYVLCLIIPRMSGVCRHAIV